jgi:hypothetical protein
MHSELFIESNSDLFHLKVAPGSLLTGALLLTTVGGKESFDV